MRLACPGKSSHGRSFQSRESGWSAFNLAFIWWIWLEELFNILYPGVFSFITISRSREFDTTNLFQLRLLAWGCCTKWCWELIKCIKCETTVPQNQVKRLFPDPFPLQQLSAIYGPQQPRGRSSSLNTPSTTTLFQLCNSEQVTLWPTVSHRMHIPLITTLQNIFFPKELRRVPHVTSR